MPPEGVVDALSRIHAALVPGGLVVDTQPVSERPVLETDAGRLGELDQLEWLDVVRAVDERVERVLREGLFALQGERRLTVTDVFDDGPEVVAYAAGLVGTRLAGELAERLAAVSTTVRLHQDVRLRVLRAL